jgi:hypothetical protein
MVDAKVGVSPNGLFHYPDVMVTCDSRDSEALLRLRSISESSSVSAIALPVKLFIIPV